MEPFKRLVRDESSLLTFLRSASAAWAVWASAGEATERIKGTRVMRQVKKRIVYKV